MAIEKSGKSIRWYHTLCRYIFWFFVFIAVAVTITDTRNSFLGILMDAIRESFLLFLISSVILLVLLYLLPFYFGYYRPHKKGLKPEGKFKLATGWFIFLVIAYLILPPVLHFAFSYKQISCSYPKMLIGDECCTPNTDFGIPMCSDEAVKANAQLDAAIKENIITKEGRELLVDKFEVDMPPDYYVIRNIKAGIFQMPLFLISYDEEGTPIYFKILYSNSTAYKGNIQDFYLDFERGMLKNNGVIPNEPEFYEHKDGKTQIALLNATAALYGTDYKMALALITSDSDLLMIQYVSQEPLFSDYYYEFRNMVWSVEAKDE